MTDTIQTKANLKGFFETNDTPTESNFSDLITSAVTEGGNAVIPDAIQTTNE